MTALSTTSFSNATLTIQYFISNIPKDPEPCTLLGLGVLTGLGFIGKKRASKHS